MEELIVFGHKSPDTDTTSRFEKERILIENKDNDFIKRVFEFVYGGE